jgi:hypothetical protein
VVCLTHSVEGFEFEVLSTIDFSSVYVRYVVTETTNKKVHKYLTTWGFRDLNLQFALGDHVFENRRPPPKLAETQ